MPRTHPPYPPEFRHQMVELVRSGRAIRELARAGCSGWATFHQVLGAVMSASRLLGSPHLA